MPTRGCAALAVGRLPEDSSNQRRIRPNLESLIKTGDSEQSQQRNGRLNKDELGICTLATCACGDKDSQTLHIDIVETRAIDVDVPFDVSEALAQERHGRDIQLSEERHDRRRGSIRGQEDELDGAALMSHAADDRTEIRRTDGAIEVDDTLFVGLKQNLADTAILTVRDYVDLRRIHQKALSGFERIACFASLKEVDRSAAQGRHRVSSANTPC